VTNLEAIKKILIVEFAYYSIATNPAQIKLWAEEMQDLDARALEKTLKDFRKESGRTKPPMPGDIRTRIFSFPDGNVAWSTVQQNQKSILWTDEMRLAFGDAYALIQENDMVAARMAFLKAYEERCKESVRQNKPPVWKISYGEQRDDDQLNKLLIEGVNEKKISIQTAMAYSPDLTLDNAGNLLTHSSKLLLETKQVENSSLSAEAKDKMIADMIARMEQRKLEIEKERELQKEKERQEWKQKKEQAKAMFDEYQRGMNEKT
jgi:hypothetical protein